MALSRMAVIYLGSFEVSLSVYEKEKSSMVLVERCSKELPLGEDTFFEGRICSEHIDKICEILEGFKEKLTLYRITDTVCLATSAIREAGNRTNLLDRIEVRTGFRIRVLSNSEQRYYAALAVSCEGEEFLRWISEPTALLDIGSGSLQLSLFDKGRLVSTQNMKLGSLRILDMLAGVKDESILPELVSELIHHECETFKRLYLEETTKNLIVLSDTTLAYLLGKKAEKKKTFWKAEEFLNLASAILKKEGGEVMHRYDIPSIYGKLMIPSLLTLYHTLLTTKAERLWISSADFADGPAADFFDRKGWVSLSTPFEDHIISSAEELSKRYASAEKHHEFLEESTLKIFDAMKKFHGLGKRERLLLRISAILHDVGKYISMRAPGESAKRIIEASEILGISHAERTLVAYVVMHNTVPFPDFDKEEGKITKKEYLTAMKLTAILRLANALDRTHKQKFRDMEVRIHKGRELVIRTETMENIELEKQLFRQKAAFFEEVYGLRPELKQVERR